MQTLRPALVLALSLGLGACSLKAPTLSGAPSAPAQPVGAFEPPLPAAPSPAAKAALTLRIRWPERPRPGFNVTAIPLLANSLVVKVLQDGRELDRRIVRRDPDQLDVTVSFDLESASNLSVEVKAYEASTPTDDMPALAQGVTSGINLYSSQTSRVSVTLDAVQAPVITGTDVNAARRGDRITVYGRNFGLSSDRVKVKFYRSAGSALPSDEVIRNPDGSLSVKVPDLATSGKIAVSVNDQESSSDAFFWILSSLVMDSPLYPGETTANRLMRAGTTRVFTALATYYPSDFWDQPDPPMAFKSSDEQAGTFGEAHYWYGGSDFVGQYSVFTPGYLTRSATASLYAQVGRVQSAPLGITTPSWIDDSTGVQPGERVTLPTTTGTYVKGLAIAQTATELLAPEHDAYVAFSNAQDNAALVTSSQEVAMPSGTRWRLNRLQVPESLRQKIRSDASLRARPVRLNRNAPSLAYVPPVEGADVSMTFTPDVTSDATVTKPASIRKVDTVSVGDKTVRYVLVVDKDDLAVINDAWIADFNDELKTRIVPRVTEVMGEPPPGDAPGLSLNGDGNVYFFFTRALVNSGGYFGTVDLLDYPESNHKSMVLLNANSPKTYLMSTLAHEYGHLVYFWDRYQAIDNIGEFERAYDSEYEAWLTEGVSVFLESYCGYGPDSSLNYGQIEYLVWQYLNTPQSIPLFPFEYDPDNSGNYGVAYLFVQYLVDRFGLDALRDVLSSHRNATYHASVSDALLKRGVTFEQFFKDFSIALMLDGTAYESQKYHIGGLSLRQYYPKLGYTLNGPWPMNASGGAYYPDLRVKPWALGYLRLATSSSTRLSTSVGTFLNGTLLVPPGSL